MDVFDLCAKISLDSTEYKEGLADGEKTSESFGSKIAGGFSTAMKAGAVAIGAMATAVGAVSKQMVSAINEVASYGDEIDKNSQKMGVSASFYQEWDAVLQHSGTSMDSMSGTFKTLSKAVQNGSAEQQEAFKKLGLSMDDLSKMSTEEAFEATIKGLQGMEEGAERTALASSLLGKGATELGALFNTSAEDTQKMIDTVNELGGVMSDDAVKASARYEDSLQDLKTVFSGAKNSMVAEFLPAVSDVMDGLTKIFSGDSDGGMALIEQGFENFQKTINDVMPKVLDTASKMLPVIVNAIADGLPMLLDVASDIVLSIADGIIQHLPELIETAMSVIGKLVDGLIEMLPMLAEACIQIIAQLAHGIAEALPDLIPTIVDIVLEIVETLLDNLDLLIDSAIEIIMALAEGLINALPRLIEKVPVIITKLIEAIVNNLPKILEMGFKLLVELGVGLIKAIPQLVKQIPTIVVALVKGFVNLMSKFNEVGKNIVEGLWNGIKAGWTWLTNKVNELVGNLVKGVKNVLGIHSPSKVFAEIGGFMADGLDEGWSDEFADVQSDINKSLNFEAGDVSVNGSSASATISDVMALLQEYLPQIGKSQIVMDTGALVGATAPAYNTALGRISMREAYR